MSTCPLSGSSFSNFSKLRPFRKCDRKLQLYFRRSLNDLKTISNTLTPNPFFSGPHRAFACFRIPVRSSDLFPTLSSVPGPQYSTRNPSALHQQDTLSLWRLKVKEPSRIEIFLGILISWDGCNEHATHTHTHISCLDSLEYLKFSLRLGNYFLGHFPWLIYSPEEFLTFKEKNSTLYDLWLDFVSSDISKP